MSFNVFTLPVVLQATTPLRRACLPSRQYVRPPGLAGAVCGVPAVLVARFARDVHGAMAWSLALVRLLASASPMRWKELPEVSTLREQGYDVEIDSWIGLAYPKGVPPALRDRLERVAMAAAEGPQVARIFESAGVDPAPLTGAAYRKKLVQGHESMGAAIKAANLPRMN